MIRRVPQAEVRGRSRALAAEPQANSEGLPFSSNPGPPACTSAHGAALARALTLLLSEELRLQPEHIARVLERELLRVRRAKCVVVSVHPDDLLLLKAPHHYVAALELEGSLALTPDPAVSRGGCVLSSNLGEIDARVETRLELALTLLRSGALA